MNLNAVGIDIQLTKLIAGKLLVEICHDDEKKV